MIKSIYLIYDNEDRQHMNLAFADKSKAEEWCKDHNATYFRTRYTYKTIAFYP